MVEFERQSGAGEQGIRSNNFGGLNTTSSLLNLPYEDSPDLLNIEVDLAGNLSKREGTDLVLAYGSTGSVPSVFTFPIRTTLGYEFLVQKNSTSLDFVLAQTQQWGSAKSYTNVWNTAANRPNVCLLPDIEPKILILTGTNQPVQVKFIEQSQTSLIVTANAFVLQNADRFAAAATDEPIVFVNGSFVAPTSYSSSYNAGTQELTVTFSSGIMPSVGQAVRVDFVNPVWQRWVESTRFFGDRYFDSLTRFNTVKADQNIAIPGPLRSDMNYVGTDASNYPIRAYTSFSPAAQIGSSPTRQPISTTGNYGFSDGSNYTEGTNQHLNTSPFFLTFGGTSGTVATSLIMLRYREIRFNGGRGVDVANMKVYLDGNLVPQATATGTTVPNTYFVSTNPGTFIGATSGLATYLAFGSSNPIGVPAVSVVDTVNVGKFGIGSAAVENTEPFTQGSCVPIHGLGQWCDTFNNSYPSLACVYQGRLALSGFSNDPTRVVFSSVASSLDDTKWNFFQVTDDLDGNATDPFDIAVSSAELDDYVTGLVDWAGFLFVLCRRSVSRVGSTGGALSSDTALVSYLTSQGLINPRCVTRTESAVYYLADGGVFALTPREADGEYQAYEKSIKIRRLFGTSNPAYRDAAWLSYDQRRKNLVMALPSSGDTNGRASNIFIYNTLRESWSQWSTPGGFAAYQGYTFIDRALGANFAMNCLRGNDTSIITLGSPRFTDFTSVATVTSGSTLNKALRGLPYARFAPFNAQPETGRTSATISLTNGSQIIGRSQWLIPYIPTVDYHILEGSKDVTSLVKRRVDGSLYLDDTNPGTRTMTLYPRRLCNFSPESQSLYVDNIQHEVVYWRNNELQIEGLDYTMDNLGVITSLNGNFGGDVVEIGLAYPCYYMSPLFTYGDLTTAKRTRHINLFFDNVDYRNTKTFGLIADQFIGDFLNTVNANVAILYDSEIDGNASWDVYGFSDIAWDDGYFDTPAPTEQLNRYSLFREPLTGIGYSNQILVFSFDHTTFKLAGYQLSNTMAGRNQYKGRRN